MCHSSSATQIVGGCTLRCIFSKPFSDVYEREPLSQKSFQIIHVSVPLHGNIPLLAFICNRTRVYTANKHKWTKNNLSAKLLLHHLIQVRKRIGALHIILLTVDDRAHNCSNDRAEQKLTLLVSKIDRPSTPLAALGDDNARILQNSQNAPHVPQDCSKTCTSSNVSSSLPP